jgi:hypothetical protein
VRQFYETSERIFARGVAVRGDTVHVVQDHVYVPGSGLFSSVTLDQLTAP